MRLSVVIVTYKSLGLIDRCLKAFDMRPDIEIIIVENASGDGISEHVRQNYPSVKFIESSENLGFAGGNNKAFELCRGQYVLLLNPDAFVEHAELIDQMADILDKNPHVAALGPRLINVDGSHQVGDAGWRIGFITIFAHAFMLQRLFGSVQSLYLTNKRLLLKDSLNVDWVCGACMMVRHDVIKQIGGMDTRIFMYGEDIEWGCRIRDGGWEILYCPVFSVLHLQGATQKLESDNFYSPKWLDDAFNRYQMIGSKLGYEVLRYSVYIGYLARWFTWVTIGRLAGRQGWKNKGRNMLGYALHALALPPYHARCRTE